MRVGQVNKALRKLRSTIRHGFRDSTAKWVERILSGGIHFVDVGIEHTVAIRVDDVRKSGEYPVAPVRIEFDALVGRCVPLRNLAKTVRVHLVGVESIGED